MKNRDILKIAKAIGWTAFSVANIASGSVLGSVVCIICAKDWWADIFGDDPI